MDVWVSFVSKFYICAQFTDWTWGVGVGVRQEVELSLPTMLDICMYLLTRLYVNRDCNTAAVEDKSPTHKNFDIVRINI